MLYREIIAVCSQIHTKHINTLCGQNVEFVNVKPGGTYSDHLPLESLYHRTFSARCCTSTPYCLSPSPAATNWYCTNVHNRKFTKYTLGPECMTLLPIRIGTVLS